MLFRSVGIFIQFVGPEWRERQFEVMKQLTRPGGRILLQGYTPQQLEYRTGGPSAVENLYTPEILREAFADWTIEELVEYEEDVSEGGRPPGALGADRPRRAQALIADPAGAGRCRDKARRIRAGFVG